MHPTQLGFFPDEPTRTVSSKSKMTNVNKEKNKNHNLLGIFVQALSSFVNVTKFKNTFVKTRNKFPQKVLKKRKTF
jgi:hypothetical protein